MTNSPTKVIFLWHMHQPYYKHPDNGYHILPWVRLHGVKDYYGMARVVDKFDKIKVVFNFSGVLLAQLLDCVNNSTQDYYEILTLKNPAGLRREEKNFIIDRFFSANFDRYIRPNRRYLQLYNKKVSPKRDFSTQDIMDLQAIFNLCWFHPYTIAEDKNLGGLILKEKGYNLGDKEYIINKQRQILSEVMPLYKKLYTDGKIELSVTPYHHPIMPLVYDTDILNNFPYLEKPAMRFFAPGDCVWHLEKAKGVFKNIFDNLPSGSWPSEGSVSEGVVSLYAKEGFKWIATDEAILFKTLTTKRVSYDIIKEKRHLIYRPYRFRNVNIFFRDRNLSDAISFVYQGWDDPVFAANDLLEHFKRIHYYVKDIFKDNVISIVMDGENAWEYYKDNGVTFLETIYGALEHSDILSTATPSEFLNQCSSSKNLERLAAGSWINGDFGVWIGSKKNNNYWSALKKLRDLLTSAKSGKEGLDEAWDAFHLIQGSDWFWWNTFEDISGEFKKIFLSYVAKIYKLFGKKPPSYLYK